MDNLQLQEEVRALRKLRKHYEDDFRQLAGLALCDLPDDVNALLDECVDLQMATNLHDLSENYLKEFYYTRKRESIENAQIVAKMQAEIREQEEQLKKEEAECAVLEKFTTEVNKRLVSEAEMLRSVANTELIIKGLVERKAAFTVPEDLDIDELMRRVDLLKQQKNKGKEF